MSRYRFAKTEVSVLTNRNSFMKTEGLVCVMQDFGYTASKICWNQQEYPESKILIQKLYRCWNY